MNCTITHAFIIFDIYIYKYLRSVHPCLFYLRSSITLNVLISPSSALIFTIFRKKENVDSLSSFQEYIHNFTFVFVFVSSVLNSSQSSMPILILRVSTYKQTRIKKPCNAANTYQIQLNT